MAVPELAREAHESQRGRLLHAWRRGSDAVGRALGTAPGRLVLWAAGLAAYAGYLVVTLLDRRGAGNTDIVLVGLVGLSFVACGLIAWRRRPENRLGRLMVLAGFAWLAAQLLGHAHSSTVFTAGLFLNDFWVVFFVVFVLSFPDGRFASRTDRLLLASFAFAAGPLELVWLLFWDLGGGRNALLVWPDADVASAIDWAQRWIFVGASLVLTAALARRWLVASPPLRRALTPILAGAAAVVVSSGTVILDKVTTTPHVLVWIVLGAILAAPLAVLGGIFRSHLARFAVGNLVVELSTNPAPGELRDALARTLGDPSLSLAYWLPEFETYADLDGRAVELRPLPGRATTLVERGAKPVAALLHDASLEEDPGLLDAVVAAAAIALENARLQSELRARLGELRESRARIVEAAQAERQRLERDLHDGAQQRLVSLSLELGLLETQLAGDPTAAHALGHARAELARSLDELRELARGIHPAVVTGRGLAVALESLATRAPVPVELTIEVAARPPEAVEVAAYYLVSESLTNVAKHACATSATVGVAQANGELVVEVSDDGVGGASTDRGSGLRGLADRVEALGGSVRVWSPEGQGTRVRAEIPCA